MSNLFNSVLVFCHSHSKLEGKLQVKLDRLLIKPIKTSVSNKISLKLAYVSPAALPVLNLLPVALKRGQSSNRYHILNYY